MFERVSGEARTVAAKRRGLDWAGRRFYARGTGSDPSGVRVADCAGPSGFARRDRGDLLPLGFELRIEFRAGVQALACHHKQTEAPVLMIPIPRDNRCNGQGGAAGSRSIGAAPPGMMAATS